MKKVFVIVIILLFISINSYKLYESRISYPVMGILDMELLLSESKRAQQLQQELTEIGNILEEKYQQEKKDLLEIERQDKLEEIYQEYLTNKERMERTFNQEIEELIVKITAEKGIDIVIHKSSVYYGGIDITNKLLEKLDDKMVEDD